MAAKTQSHTITNDKGLATVESLPLLVIFLVLITYGLGLFGVIHTAILGSISARAYAFETFKHRANLNLFFYDTQSGTPASYRSFGVRLHAVTKNQTGTSPDWKPMERPIVFGRAPAWAPPGSTASISDHNERIYQLNPGRNRRVSVTPAWVMVGYGICLNADCGDN